VKDESGTWRDGYEVIATHQSADKNALAGVSGAQRRFEDVLEGH
jgi:hypothetical protein